MDPDDRAKRIAELESQLAEQKRMAELEHRQANAVGQPPQAGFGRQRPRRQLIGARTVWRIVWLSFMVAGATVFVIPSGALWTSGIMCSGPYHLAHTSSYSYGHGTNVDFQCVSGDNSYDVNVYAIAGLQFLLALLVIGGGVLMWRLLRNPN